MSMIAPNISQREKAVRNHRYKAGSRQNTDPNDLTFMNLNLKMLISTQNIENSISIQIKQSSESRKSFIDKYMNRMIRVSGDSNKAQLYRWRKSHLWWLHDTRHITQILSLMSKAVGCSFKLNRYQFLSYLFPFVSCYNVEKISARARQ